MAALWLAQDLGVAPLADDDDDAGDAVAPPAGGDSSGKPLIAELGSEGRRGASAGTGCEEE